MADQQIEIAEQIPASKKLGASEAAGLLKNASRLYVAKGKKLSEFSGGEAAPEAVAAMLGPTGNLRAPTMVHGRALLVGFNQELFERVLS
ncbi:MAG: hypothetical protein OXC05_03030 [Halieaceae bacterium]|nr:hypothetical protein [Halieaceae bacterium]